MDPCANRSGSDRSDMDSDWSRSEFVLGRNGFVREPIWIGSARHGFGLGPLWIFTGPTWMRARTDLDRIGPIWIRIGSVMDLY